MRGGGTFPPLLFPPGVNYMNYKFPLNAFLLLTVTFAGAQVSSHAPTVITKAQPQPNFAMQSGADKPVARVNSSVLTNADLIREEYAIFPYAKQHEGIPKEFEKQIRDGALKMMIFEELVYQESLRRHMVIPAAKMQHAEVEFRKQFATPEEYNTFLQVDFRGSHQQLQEKIRRSLLIEAFLKAEVEDKCEITPAQIRAFYGQNSARFHHSETFTLQTISVMPPANATAAQLKEARARADKALQQAKATKTAEQFGLLAEKISEDDYHVMMGQHKPMAAEEIAPPVLKVLRSMHPNDVSDLIQVDQIYTIVRLQVHTQAGQTPYEEVRPKLKTELQQSKRNQLRSALDQKLRQNAKIEEM
jgi:peptidyl-prolyl cis-trans isomerase SurA